MSLHTKTEDPKDHNHTTNSSDSSFLEYLQMREAMDLKPSEEHIEWHTNQLFGPGVNSSNRLPTMLYLLEDFTVKPEVWWPVFHTVWNACDVTWEHREELIDSLSAVDDMAKIDEVHSRDFLSAENKAAFESLPQYIRIYRGCTPSRIYGFSWTTDRKVAEEFARGHRGVSIPDAVIATLRIPKDLLLGFYNDRKESEVFIDFSSIEHYSIAVTKFTSRSCYENTKDSI